MNAVRTLLAVGAAAALLLTAHAADPEKEKKAPIRVTVVVVRATTENNVVDVKLTTLAKAVQARDASLVGFKLDSVLQKSIPVGDAHTFDLLEQQTLKVTIDEPKDKNGRVGMTVTASTGESVSYTCVCDRFFPLMIKHRTKGGEQVIVAVGAKPCTGKGP